MKLPGLKSISRLIVFPLLILSLFLSSPQFILAANDSDVLGAATADLTETQKTLLFAKPAVTQVTNIITGKLVLQLALASELGAPTLAGQSYPFEIAGSGSGFFVTPDGYLITNGHVAKASDEIVAYYAIQQTAKAIFKDVVKTLVQIYYGYTPTDAELETAFQLQLQESYGGDMSKLVASFYEGYEAGEMKMSNVKHTNYVQTGVAVGSEKLVKEKGKVANLVDTSYKGEFDSKDLALLKVEGENFPTISLGSFENVNLGTEVYAIGYPGVVEQLMGLLTDTESELEPSITKGIISAKKKLVDGTEAFQTDAAITHGNSGGPAIDTDGKVVGVATWGFGDVAGGESFNFLISVEKVEQLLSRNSVTPSRSLVNDVWEKGIELYSNQHYSAAIAEFEKAKNLYPNNVDIDDYIAQAEAAVARGEDIPLLFGFRQEYVLLALGAGGLLFVVVIGGGFVLILKKKKGSGPAAQPQVQQQPVQQAAPQAQATAQPKAETKKSTAPPAKK